MSNPKHILVTGGTGKTGRRVVEQLKARQIAVRVGSRKGEPPFDWNDQTIWAAALHGIDAVYITYQPDLAVPGALDTIKAFSQQAVEAGVTQLVLLSGRGEPEAQAGEQIIQDSGVDWTIVRASWFNQNFSEDYLLDAVLAGEVVLPAGDVGEPFIDADDIADVVVASLLEEGHSGQVYEVTGPRLLSFGEAVAEIASASGRPVHYVSVTLDQYKAAMLEQHVPEAYVGLLEYLFAAILDGRNAHLSDGVQRALGRPPRDFADYARETAATGVWQAQTDPANA